MLDIGMQNTTAATRKQGLDKFYTRASVATSCIEAVGARFPWESWDLCVEPSAGNGRFFLQLPSAKRVGLDLEPEHPEIQKQDFFTYSPPATASRVLVIGNPPFGRVSSLAVKFFNHAALWATVIAFIVPRTFRRVSLQRRLDLQFHLLEDLEIPTEPCAFEPPMQVKCCFQIWIRKTEARVCPVLPLQHPHWNFLALGTVDTQGQPTPPQGADFVVRAYGGQCGEIVSNGLQACRPKSWHWIQARIPPHILKARFETLDYSLSENTARQNSLGRAELILLYTEAYADTSISS